MPHLAAAFEYDLRSKYCTSCVEVISFNNANSFMSFPSPKNLLLLNPSIRLSKRLGPFYSYFIPVSTRCSDDHWISGRFVENGHKAFDSEV